MKQGAPRARVVHIVDAPDQVASHCALAGSAAGDLSKVLDDLAEAAVPRKPGDPWLERLQDAVAVAMAADGSLLASDSSPVHPMRIYGELTRILDDDAVVIGDGGDFVSYAGKYVEPKRPGGWLDPGPYRCLGTGLRYAIAARLARPGSQVALLLGDGAAGFSLMGADTPLPPRLPRVVVFRNDRLLGPED